MACGPSLQLRMTAALCPAAVAVATLSPPAWWWLDAAQSLLSSIRGPCHARWSQQSLITPPPHPDGWWHSPGVCGLLDHLHPLLCYTASIWASGPSRSISISSSRQQPGPAVSAASSTLPQAPAPDRQCQDTSVRSVIRTQRTVPWGLDLLRRGLSALIIIISSWICTERSINISTWVQIISTDWLTEARVCKEAEPLISSS